MMVFKLFAAEDRATPVMAPGRRVYAVGDVHGRLDLLDELLGRIERDDAARRPAHTTVVFLGDLIDRGPQSAAVVDRVRTGIGFAASLCLKGNHEAAMIGAIGGDAAAARMWLRHGGLDTLASWGVADDVLERADLVETVAAAREVVPAAERRWLADLPLSYRVGDFYFVHAGVRPGVDLDRQTVEDRLWIREDFLDARGDHGAVVVHGHSVSAEVENRHNRIGIDTGAHATGRLSAVGLDGTDRWFLQTRAPN